MTSWFIDLCTFEKKSNGVVVAVHSLLLLWSHQANSDNDSVAINVVIKTIWKLMQRHTLSSHQTIFLRKIKWNLVFSSLTSHQSERSLNVPCLFHDSHKIILFQVDLQHGLGNRSTISASYPLTSSPDHPLPANSATKDPKYEVHTLSVAYQWHQT